MTTWLTSTRYSGALRDFDPHFDPGRVERGRRPCGLGAAQEIPLGFPSKTRVAQCRWADFRGRNKSLELSLCEIDILREKPLRNPCGNPKFQGEHYCLFVFGLTGGGVF